MNTSDATSVSIASAPTNQGGTEHAALHQTTGPGCYSRKKPLELDPEDARDLEDYFELLRSYYSIPADQPVFPPLDHGSTGIESGSSAARRDRSAKNRQDHPWRQR